MPLPGCRSCCRAWGSEGLGQTPSWPPVVSPTPGFLDWVPKKMQRVGCVELLNTVQRRVQPRLHVFGHIHEGQYVVEMGTSRARGS